MNQITSKRLLGRKLTTQLVQAPHSPRCRTNTRHSSADRRQFLSFIEHAAKHYHVETTDVDAEHIYGTIPTNSPVSYVLPSLPQMGISGASGSGGAHDSGHLMFSAVEK